MRERVVLPVPALVMKHRVCITLWLMICVLAAWAYSARADPPSDPAQKWEELMSDSEKTLKSSDVPGAIRLCDEAMDMATRFGTNDTRLSKTQILRAEIYLWEKKNDEAGQMFKLAVASCEKAAGSNSPEMIYPLSSLANYYFIGVPQNERILPLYQRILSIVQVCTNRDPHDVIMWSRNLGMVYQRMGRYAEGEPFFKQAVTVAEHADAGWEPYELLNEAEFYRAWGKYEPAAAAARRALTVREEKLKTDNGVDARSDVAVCLNNLGTTYLAWNKPAEAEAVYRRSLAMIQTFMAPDQADLIPYLAGLAMALRADGELEEAEAPYQRVLTITVKNMGPENPDTASWLEKYAALLNDLKEPEKAQILLERARKIRQQNMAKIN